MRRTKIDEDMVFPAVRDTFKKKRFRERHPGVFNALVAFIVSLATCIVLNYVGCGGVIG